MADGRGFDGRFVIAAGVPGCGGRVWWAAEWLPSRPRLLLEVARLVVHSIPDDVGRARTRDPDRQAAPPPCSTPSRHLNLKSLQDARTAAMLLPHPTPVPRGCLLYTSDAADD